MATEAEQRDIQRFNKLTGNYKHYCPDWDYDPIDDTCPEFASCTCEFENE